MVKETKIRSVSRCKIDLFKWGSRGWPVLKKQMDLYWKKLVSHEGTDRITSHQDWRDRKKDDLRNS